MTPRRLTMLAMVLWLVLAFLVWNVVFDRMIVLAGRRYSHDAAVLYRTTGHYLLINDVMRPAAAHAGRVATAVAAAIGAVAMILIRVASTRSSQRARR